MDLNNLVQANCLSLVEPQLNPSLFYFLLLHAGIKLGLNQVETVSLELTNQAQNTSWPKSMSTSVDDGPKKINFKFVKIRSVTAEILLIWTNVRKTNVNVCGQMSPCQLFCTI